VPLAWIDEELAKLEDEEDRNLFAKPSNSYWKVVKMATALVVECSLTIERTKVTSYGKELGQYVKLATDSIAKPVEEVA
jgi:hypothetical protein